MTANWPLTIELTPNGKTLAVVYPSRVQGRLVAGLLRMLGEPETIAAGELDPDNILILFPHQDMPEDLADMAERMSSANLLHSLGFDQAGDHHDAQPGPAASEGSPGPAPDPRGIEEYEVAGNWLEPDICEGDLVRVDRSQAAADGDVVFMPWRERQCIVQRYRVDPGGQHYLQDRYGNRRIPADASFIVVTERQRKLKQREVEL